MMCSIWAGTEGLCLAVLQCCDGLGPRGYLGSKLSAQNKYLQLELSRLG